MKIKIKDFLSFIELDFRKTDGTYHRLNKPAQLIKHKDLINEVIHIEYMYYQNNQLYCLSGPAMKCSGCKRDDLYYINGISYISKESWLLKLEELSTVKNNK